MTARPTELEAAALELERAERDLEAAEKHFAECNEALANAVNSLTLAQRRQMEATFRHRVAANEAAKR